MSETVELYIVSKEHEKECKQKRSDRAIKKLEQLKVSFSFSESQKHAVLTLNCGTIIDFWTSTGSFFNRKTKLRAKGFDLLKKHIEGVNHDSE